MGFGMVTAKIGNAVVTPRLHQQDSGKVRLCCECVRARATSACFREGIILVL